MRNLKGELKAYLGEKLRAYDLTVERKLISYEPVGDEFSVHMRDGMPQDQAPIECLIDELTKGVMEIYWSMGEAGGR